MQQPSLHVRFVAAGWLDAMLRSGRLNEIRPRVYAAIWRAVGPSGALANMAHSPALANDLHLAFRRAWHTSRSSAEVANGSALLRCGQDRPRYLSLSQTEIAELPTRCRGRGACLLPCPQTKSLLRCGPRRGLWRVPPPRSTMLAHDSGRSPRASALACRGEPFRKSYPHRRRPHHLAKMLHDLQLYPARMRENLELTRGLIFAEAVSMTLAKSLGKMAAHQLVESACKAAVTEKRHLKDVLANDPVTSTKLTAAEIENLFDPQKYVGSAGIFIDNVIANARRITSA